MNVLAIFAAALLQLGGGYNNAGVAGEVAAINAATSNATATVTVKSVESLTLYTNATQQVVTYEPAWRVTYTNYDGAASISTNVLGYLDWEAFKSTNGVQRIIGEPVRFDMAITNTVIVGQVAAQTFAKTNTLATVTTSGHFGTVSTNAFLFGGGILVDGAEPTDKINILIK